MIQIQVPLYMFTLLFVAGNSQKWCTALTIDSPPPLFVQQAPRDPSLNPKPQALNQDAFPSIAPHPLYDSGDERASRGPQTLDRESGSARWTDPSRIDASTKRTTDVTRSSKPYTTHRSKGDGSVAAASPPRDPASFNEGPHGHQPIEFEPCDEWESPRAGLGQARFGTPPPGLHLGRATQNCGQAHLGRGHPSAGGPAHPEAGGPAHPEAGPSFHVRRAHHDLDHRVLQDPCLH